MLLISITLDIEFGYAQNDTTKNENKVNENNQPFTIFLNGIPAIIGVISGGAVAVVGIYLNNNHNRKIIKQQHEYTIEIENRKSLSKNRIDTYKEIFSLMTSIAIYSPIKPIQTYMHLKEISESFTKWYYVQKGGLFMNTESQLSYLKFQDKIMNILDKESDKNGNGFLGQEMDTNILKEVIGLAMQFRLSLQKEINIDLKPIEDKILKEILGKSINVYYKNKSTNTKNT